MTPNNSFIRWAGGKTWLIPLIKQLVDGLEYERFIEPFMGSASVFFALDPQRPSILSDINEELVNLFEAVKEKPNLVISYMKRYGTDEKSYYEVRESEPTGKYTRAARFLYLNTYSFNGLYRVNRQGKFNVPYGHRKTVYENERLYEANKKLQCAEIRCQDFFEIENDIHKNDLIFLDPPYAVENSNTEIFLKYTSTLFSMNDQHRLAELIDLINEKEAYFILSNAYHETIFDIFKDKGRVIRCERNSLIGGKSAYRGRVNEYVFTNIDY